jgi:hypothetical protein
VEIAAAAMAAVKSVAKTRDMGLPAGFEMASGAGVIAPIRAGKLVASALALNDYREFTLMRIVNGGRTIQVAFDQSSLDGVEPAVEIDRALADIHQHGDIVRRLASRDPCQRLGVALRRVMEAVKVALFTILVAAPFLGAHLVASIYAEPKAQTEECAKPYSSPGSRADLSLHHPG